MGCGAALRTDAGASYAPVGDHAETSAERRQITVMFCDLVDSTALSARLDPEDLRGVLGRYQSACVEVVQRFDGHVAQYLGDGVLVYFGYPHAHEDDAERAIRAGLAIVHAVERSSIEVGKGDRIELSVRIGIHTGPVVVGTVGAGAWREDLALGETPNVAARAQSSARPGTVVVTAATHRLVTGRFVSRTLRPRMLKGLSSPVTLYEVLSEGALSGRVDIGATTGLTPLVGREAELQQLLEIWRTASEGAGRVVVVRGEAGIGKSRLLHALKQRSAGWHNVRLEARCSPYYVHTPLHPVVDLMTRALASSPHDDPATRREELAKTLVPFQADIPDALPLLAALLSIPAQADDPLLAMSPERQRERTLDALVRLLIAMTRTGPVMFVVEDLHWVDPTTVELLRRIIERAPSSRLLVILTARPTFEVPWNGLPHVCVLDLAHLAPHDTLEMVTRIAGGKSLPVDVVRQIVDKADGVPLFAEELTKMILESDLLHEDNGVDGSSGPIAALAIPSTLQDLLTARLDRLGPAKAVVQLGATIGRAFSWNVMRALSPLDDAALADALSRAADADLLQERGTPDTTYVFKHALIQDAAYQSLLRSTRQQYHRRIADMLVERFPETAEIEPELLAHHYTSADRPDEAITYWLRAGQRASARSACAEAITHLTQGLQLLAAQSPSPARLQRELDFQTTLASVLSAVKGPAAPETGRAYDRARELCTQVGTTPKLVWALDGLWGFYLVRGDLRRALELGEQLLAIARQLDRPFARVVAHQTLGMTLLYSGNLSDALTHLEQGSALYDTETSRPATRRGLHDAGVTCRAFAGLALCLRGQPRLALERITATVEFAHRHSHPYDVAYTRLAAAVTHMCRREPAHTLRESEAAIAIAREQGFPLWKTMGDILSAWAIAMQGNADEGTKRIATAVAAWKAMGADNLLPWFLALLAEAALAAGNLAEAGPAVDESLRLLDRTGERWWEAETHRVRGELLWRRAPSDPSSAEAALQCALDVARAQGAALWELRASTSLARLFRATGRGHEAESLLRRALSRITDADDIADARDAHTLLQEAQA